MISKEDLDNRFRFTSRASDLIRARKFIIDVEKMQSFAISIC